MYSSTWIKVCLHVILVVKTTEEALANRTGCSNPLGMQSGLITNAQIRASSSKHHQFSPPYAARLFNTRSSHPLSFGAWCSRKRDLHQYLLIDFLNVKNITAISSQGVWLAGKNWVSSYSVSYSCDGRLWLPHMQGGIPKIFDANNDTDSVVRNSLHIPIVARMVRIHPITWKYWGSICIRIEIHGCNSNQICRPTALPTSPPPSTTWSYTTAHDQNSLKSSTQPAVPTTIPTTTQAAPTQPPCTNSLGMEDYRIEDSQITASSFKSTLTHPSSARLNNRLKHTMSFGSWCASTANTNQYLQIDLRTPTTIVAIATQGMASPEGNWVTSYSVSYSCVGTSWFLYEERGKQKVFKGNSDSQSTVKHHFETPLTSRLVRLKPVTWNAIGEICLRMELYGCNKTEVCTIGNISESVLPSTTTSSPQEPHTTKTSASIPIMHSNPTTHPTTQKRATKQQKRIVIIYKEIEDDEIVSCCSSSTFSVLYMVFLLLLVMSCIA